MELILLASVLFLGTHLGVTSTSLRGTLVKGLGEQAYLGVYSLLAAITLGFLIYAYAHESHSHFIWLPDAAQQAFTKIVVLLAFILLISGFMAKNPTAVMSDAVVEAPLAGILKITRHPVQWAILLWALGHLVSNGDQASIVFFGSFILLSAVGMAAIDARRKFREEPAWQRFYASTSSVPFVALITGKTSMKINELNWMAVGAGVVLFVIVFIFHKTISGVALY